MNELLKTNVPGLYKDPSTNVIINRNYDELEAHRMARQRAKELAEMKSNVENLKKDCSEIKVMLQKIIEGIK